MSEEIWIGHCPSCHASNLALHPKHPAKHLGNQNINETEKRKSLVSEMPPSFFCQSCGVRISPEEIDWRQL
jgi:hypothetical protein